MTREPVMIGAQVSIREAQEVFHMWGMRHLPVTNNDNELIGIVSERDIAKAYAGGLKGTTTVSEIMTEDPYKVLPHTPLGEVAQCMAENKYGCAIVVDVSMHVKGIFTTTDALFILAKMLHGPNDTNYKLLKIEDYIQSYKIA
ncbi:MAG: CBS domain-containing protein [Bdellovibrionaceae bacterium]|nr:CBS domain-containing protein [Pseudobdellovibrionaceae bacterium]